MKVKNVQLIKNDVCEPSKFRAIPEIAYKGDSTGALSSIPLNVLMINDVRNCYMCKIGDIGDLEIRESYARLCDIEVLKEEFKIIERKGLTMP